MGPRSFLFNFCVLVWLLGGAGGAGGLARVGFGPTPLCPSRMFDCSSLVKAHKLGIRKLLTWHGINRQDSVYLTLTELRIFIK